MTAHVSLRCFGHQTCAGFLQGFLHTDALPLLLWCYFIFLHPVLCPRGSSCCPATCSSYQNELCWPLSVLILPRSSWLAECVGKGAMLRGCSVTGGVECVLNVWWLSLVDCQLVHSPHQVRKTWAKPSGHSFQLACAFEAAPVEEEVLLSPTTEPDYNCVFLSQ